MSGQGAFFNGADPYTPAPTGSANSGPRALDGPGYPHMVLAFVTLAVSFGLACKHRKMTVALFSCLGGRWFPYQIEHAPWW